MSRKLYEDLEMAMYIGEVFPDVPRLAGCPAVFDLSGGGEEDEYTEKENRGYVFYPTKDRDALHVCIKRQNDSNRREEVLPQW